MTQAQGGKIIQSFLSEGRQCKFHPWCWNLNDYIIIVNVYIYIFRPVGSPLVMDRMEKNMSLRGKEAWVESKSNNLFTVGLCSRIFFTHTHTTSITFAKMSSVQILDGFLRLNTELTHMTLWHDCFCGTKSVFQKKLTWMRLWRVALQTSAWPHFHAYFRNKKLSN